MNLYGPAPMRRREFLQWLGMAAGAAALAGRARAQTVSPNDKINVAHIGVGGMGSGHLGWFAAMPDVNIAAICDVDSTRLDAAVATAKTLQPNADVRGYRDFRHVLDRDDIDVVTCATPDHWHTLITTMAFEAGKDVYSEKPLCRTVAESHAMVEARQRYGRVFQLGTQIHAEDNYHRAVELVRSGILGKIHTVRLWKTGGSPGLGFPADEAPPPELDWEMWQGPTVRRPYTPVRCHFTFRYFWDYSGGNWADFWCHIADIAFWALDLGQPKRIHARGATPTDGIADTPATIDVDYEFDGLNLHWSTDIPDVPGADARGIGCQFEGSEGSMVVDYGSRAIFLGGERLDDVPEVPQSIPRSPGHQRNFLDCVRSRGLTESNLDYAHNMTLPMLLGCISFRLQRPLEWDAAAQRFVGDATANRMLSTPYHQPWVLPQSTIFAGRES